MNALDKIFEKLLSEMTEIETAIWYTAGATTAYDMEKAAQDLARITAERDKLFQLAVLTFKALEDIGLILTPNARALDSACTNLSPELWERIDVEASK